MSNYLQYTDIKDKLVQAFGQTEVETYFDKVDGEILDIAETCGIFDDSLISETYRSTNRIHYKIIEFGIHWLCYLLLLDKAGVNNATMGPDMEKYYVKAAEHKRLADMYRGQITKRMFTGHINNASDRVSYSAIMIRS